MKQGQAEIGMPVVIADVEGAPHAGESGTISKIENDYWIEVVLDKEPEVPRLYHPAQIDAKK